MASSTSVKRTTCMMMNASWPLLAGELLQLLGKESDLVVAFSNDSVKESVSNSMLLRQHCLGS
ncbi:MAG: hypothetical protein IPL41_03430 [Micropruina sp.]|nr:hypothetical protein [Micropruina sp.]